MDIHPHAAKGFQGTAEAYERGRPDYPREAVDQVLLALGVSPGARVLDLGAGTGKFTRLLVPSGAAITAVEPVEAMRAQFKKMVPGVRVVDGTAENIPLGKGTYSGVVCAQAFHWFDGPKALAEIHRVLRPEGRLALVWNFRDDNEDWVKKLGEIMNRHAGDSPTYKDMRWKTSFESGGEGQKLFGELQHKSFRHKQTGTIETIVDRVGSVSYIGALPEAQRNEVLQETRKMLRAHPQTAGKALIELPYRTDVYWAQRL